MYSPINVATLIRNFDRRSLTRAASESSATVKRTSSFHKGRHVSKIRGNVVKRSGTVSKKAHSSENTKRENSGQEGIEAKIKDFELKTSYHNYNPGLGRRQAKGTRMLQRTGVKRPQKLDIVAHQVDRRILKKEKRIKGKAIDNASQPCSKPKEKISEEKLEKVSVTKQKFEPVATRTDDITRDSSQSFTDDLETSSSSHGLVLGSTTNYNTTPSESGPSLLSSSDSTSNYNLYQDSPKVLLTHYPSPLPLLIVTSRFIQPSILPVAVPFHRCCPISGLWCHKGGF